MSGSKSILQEILDAQLAPGGGGSTDTTNIENRLGATNESAAGTDTATSGLNGLIKRLLQRITTLLGVLPSSLGAKTGANSFSVVPATDSGLATTNSVVQVRDRIATRNPSSHPEVLIQVFNSFSLTGTSSATNLNMQEFDWSGGTFQGVQAFWLTGKTVNNATAPGAGREFTLNIYWSDEQIPNPSTNVPIQLADRKIVLRTVSIPNTASTTRFWELGDIQIPKARYFYVSADKTAFDSGASVALTVYAVRVM